MAEGRTIAVTPGAGGDPRRHADVPRSCAVRRAPWPSSRRTGSARNGTLGADQSHTSVVLGERLLLKAYRRLQPGLNPDLEMTAFLSEEAGFPAVPRLCRLRRAGRARDGEPTTVAMAQAFVRRRRGRLRVDRRARWSVGCLRPARSASSTPRRSRRTSARLRPGCTPPSPMGGDCPEMAPREAHPRGGRDRGRRPHDQHLARALDLATGEAATLLRDLAPRIAEAISVLDGVADRPRGHPRARRLPPRTGADRAGRLSDRRLRGRAAQPARGAPRSSTPAAGRRVDAPLDRPRRRAAPDGARRRRTADPSRTPASTSMPGSNARASGSSRLTGQACSRRRVWVGHRPGPLARLRGRQGALRVRLRGDVPADLAVRAYRGNARALPGPGPCLTAA